MAVETLRSGGAAAAASSDVQVCGMLLFHNLALGEHPYGTSPDQCELNLRKGSYEHRYKAALQCGAGLFAGRRPTDAGRRPAPGGAARPEAGGPPGFHPGRRPVAAGGDRRPGRGTLCARAPSLLHAQHRF